MFAVRPTCPLWSVSVVLLDLIVSKPCTISSWHTAMFVPMTFFPAWPVIVPRFSFFFFLHFLFESIPISIFFFVELFRTDRYYAVPEYSFAGNTTLTSLSVLSDMHYFLQLRWVIYIHIEILFSRVVLPLQSDWCLSCNHVIIVWRQVNVRKTAMSHFRRKPRM